MRDASCNWLNLAGCGNIIKCKLLTAHRKSLPGECRKPESISQIKMVKITSAAIKDIYDVWRRKPIGISWNDTDIIIVKATDGNSKIQKTFFTCIKPDGTFSLQTADRNSKARRMELAHFLVRNKFAKMEDIRSYNLKERVKEWVGKEVVF